MLTCNLFQHTCFSCLKSTFFILSYQLHCCWLDDPHRFPGPTHSTGGRGVDVMTMTMAGGVGGGPGTWNIYIYHIYIYVYNIYIHHLQSSKYLRGRSLDLLPSSTSIGPPRRVSKADSWPAKFLVGNSVKTNRKRTQKNVPEASRIFRIGVFGDILRETSRFLPNKVEDALNEM